MSGTLVPRGRAHDSGTAGGIGLQPDGSYITPEGDHASSARRDKATHLHTVQDWIVAPQVAGSVEGVAGIDSLCGFEREYSGHP